MSRLALVCIMALALLALCLSSAIGQAENFLVGYWPFDEGIGKETRDASGKGHDGDLIDDPKWIDGKFAKALDFGGTGSYVSVPDDDELDLTDSLTIMSWFKINEPIAGQRRVMSKNNSIFIMFDFGGPDSLDFLIKPNNDFVESTTVFEIGTWYHFAATFDNGKMWMYINGELEGEKDGTPSIEPSDLDLWIGADDWQLPTTSFPGALDDVRFYSRPLSKAEIMKAMSGPMAVEMTEEKLPVTWSIVKTDRY